jgi:hypothetical protein
MDTTLRPGVNGPALTGPLKRTNTPAVTQLEQSTAENQPQTTGVLAAPLKRGLSNWDVSLQGNVARAQRAIDYLERVEGELESVKAALSAKLAGQRTEAADLEAKLHSLQKSLAARASKGGGGVDAHLDFEDGQPARQAFRITGLEASTIQAASPLTLALSVGPGGGQVSASFDPDMDAEQIAAQLDRALAPVQVRAQLQDGRLVFSTDEASWPAVKDSIVLAGRGRANTEAVQPDLNLQGMDTGNVDALRQSLREVVQALERVRRSQSSASAALSAATAKTVQPEIDPQALMLSAQDFSTVAASHDYQSLLAITSALSGVSRERVQALLGLR